MAMEINGTYTPYLADYAEQLKTDAERVERAEKTERTDEKKPDPAPDLQDTYISSEMQDTRPSGLYQLGQDENGQKKVFFDDPRKADSKDEDAQLGAKPVHPDSPAEKCTGNTDAVDRKIEKLKQKKKELEQQISAASGDEKRVRELKRKLAQVENELNQKDNDTYRRQHSTFTEV